MNQKLRPPSAVRSTHTRQPSERITLEECQALIASKYNETVLPVRVASRYAIVASVASLIISLLAFVVAVVR